MLLRTTLAMQASSPRYDSLLWTTLTLQHLAHVTTHCYGLATTTRPYQWNVKTGTSIYQQLDRPQQPATITQLHSTAWPISAYQHQTSSCISTTRPTPATLVERPAAHNYNSTIPANDITHPSWRPHTTATDIYIHVCNSSNKNVTFVVSVISPSVSLHCLLLSLHISTHKTLK